MSLDLTAQRGGDGSSITGENGGRRDVFSASVLEALAALPLSTPRDSQSIGHVCARSLIGSLTEELDGHVAEHCCHAVTTFTHSVAPRKLDTDLTQKLGAALRERECAAAVSDLESLDPASVSELFMLPPVEQISAESDA